jgi:hypothetical protein
MENIENIENENLVTEEVVETEQVAENVETTTEETPKTYTEAEFNAKLDEVLGKKIGRAKDKIRKEYERKYGNLEEVLRAGTGKESVDEITDTFRDFYEKKGIKFNPKPTYSDRDIEVLATAEAKDIISYGYDEVVEEVDRLAQIGVANMTPKDKAMFKTLAEYRQTVERGIELAKMGVKEDVYASREFKDFADMFNPNTPITKIYELYSRENKPKKEIRTMGSMKQNPDKGVKDYYSPAEIDKLTEEDLADPKVWEAVRRSMTGR